MNAAWIVWFCVALALTLPALAWHVEIFRTHSPAAVASKLWLVPVVVAALIAGFVAMIRRAPLQTGPLLLALAPIAVCLFREPRATVAAMLLFAAAHTIGARLVTDNSPAARIAIRFGLGIGVIIVSLFFLGLAGQLNLYVAAILLAPGLFAKPLAGDIRELFGRWTTDLRAPLPSVLLCFAILFAGLGALWSITPTIAFDPLKMHLASARWYVETATFQPLPTVAESYYPQGAELLMALLWIVSGGQPGAQLLAPLFLVGAVLISIAILRGFELTRIQTLAGLTAATSLPFLHWTAFVAKNDFPLAFFLLASLYCLSQKRLMPATFFLAMAFGIKHVALFGAIGLTPVFLWTIWQSERRIRNFVAVGALFLAFGTLSLVRTYALTGNPIYPERGNRTTDFSVINHPYQSTYERVMRYAGIPWLLHFDGRRAFESTSHNPMGAWLVFFWPALIPFLRKRHAALVFIGLYLLYWVSILVTLRYAIAPILLIAALSAAPLEKLPRWPSIAAASYCLFFSLTVCVLLEVTAPQLVWLARRTDTNGFLSAALPEYASVRSLANTTGRVFSIDNCANVYSPHIDRFQCLFKSDAANDPNRIVNEARQGHFQYLILPAHPIREAVLRALPPARQIHSDARFSVHEFAAPLQ
jgi:hypothetical protein